MLLSEPQSTAYDLRFRVGPIPVRVHPFFWLLTLLMASHHGDPMTLVIWVAVCFISILVHELGHALAMIRYGERPRIVLYGMGGLAISDGGGGWARSKLVGGGRGRQWLEQVIVSAAGPGAGFLLAGLVVALVMMSGGKVLWFPPTWERPFFFMALLENPKLSLLATQMLWVNIFWGLMNLLPVNPLDGGRIASTVLVARDSWRGRQQAMWLSVFAAGAVAAIAFFAWDQMYLGFFFAYLAVTNYLAAQNRSW